MTKIRCPECGRILGDTNRSMDCTLNCKGCRRAVRIRMYLTQFADYFHQQPSRRHQ